MDELYIPGFTNHLYSSEPDYGMAMGQPMYNELSMYGEKVGAPYEMVPDVYNTPIGSDYSSPGDLVLAGPRPTRMPAPDIAVPYRKPSMTPGLDFVTNGGQQGYYFVTNAGRAAKTKANPTAFVSLDPNATYRLVNERGQNKILTSGMGEQGLRDAYAMAQQLSAQGGKKADWYLERSGPSGQWTRIADDDPKGSDLGVFGKIAGFALPVATALLTGGMSLPAQMALSGLAGGVGGVLAGKDPLKGALLSAGTAGLIGATGLDKAIGGALSNIGGQTAGQATGQVAGQVAGQAAGRAAGDIVVNGLTRAALGAGSAIAQGGLQAGLNAATSGSPMSGGSGSSTPSGDAGADALNGDIVVTGGTAPSLNLGGALANIPASVALGFTPPSNEIVVTGAEKPAVPQEQLPVAVPPLSGAGVYNPVANEIAVTGPQTTQPDLPNASIPLALPTLQTLPTGPQPDLLQNAKPDEKVLNQKDTLDKIIDYLRLGGLGIGALGSLFEGGGGGQKFTMPAGSVGLSSVFNAKLPAPNMPGGVGTGGTGARSPADLAGQGLRSPLDYYRYGYGPQQSFFNYVPQGAPNTSQAYTGYAEGGYAVEGPGDGRDDKIPALLSDGEYVIDAETVALLGNGSNKAGAELLDNFRVNVRKQKGQKLARGEFSEDAKRPEHYMAGGYA